MIWKSMDDILMEFTKEQKKWPIQNDYDKGYFMGLSAAKSIIADSANIRTLKDEHEVED